MWKEFLKIVKFSFFASIWIICVIIAYLARFSEEIAKSLAQKAKAKAGLT